MIAFSLLYYFDAIKKNLSYCVYLSLLLTVSQKAFLGKNTDEAKRISAMIPVHITVSMHTFSSSIAQACIKS